MLDYHALKNEIKSAILVRLQQIELADDPLPWLWLVKALSVDGTHNNPLVMDSLDQAEKWLTSAEAWNSNKYLGSISLLCHLLHQFKGKKCDAEIQKVIEFVQSLREKEIRSSSHLNDPRFVYPLVLGSSSYLSSNLRSWLEQLCEQYDQPSVKWSRRLQFAAAAKELGVNVSKFSINSNDLEIYEVVIALWFSERYPQLIDSEERRRQLWEALENVKEGICLDESETAAKYPVSAIELAMLYEAVLSQATEIDPVTLFNNFPWHPEIRKVSESLFLKGEYVVAVVEAGKLFIESVKVKSGHPVNSGNGKPLDGRPLMEFVFPTNLKLEFRLTVAISSRKRAASQRSWLLLAL